METPPLKPCYSDRLVVICFAQLPGGKCYVLKTEKRGVSRDWPAVFQGPLPTKPCPYAGTGSAKWKSALAKCGKTNVVIAVLEFVEPGNDWGASERAWVKWAKEYHGEMCCNVAEGGDGNTTEQAKVNYARSWADPVKRERMREASRRSGRLTGPTNGRLNVLRHFTPAKCSQMGRTTGPKNGQKSGKASALFSARRRKEHGERPWPMDNFLLREVGEFNQLPPHEPKLPTKGIKLDVYDVLVEVADAGMAIDGIAKTLGLPRQNVVCAIDHLRARHFIPIELTPDNRFRIVHGLLRAL